MSQAETLQAMANAISKIIENDPTAFAHNADPSHLQAIDIDKKRVKPDTNALIKAFTEDKARGNVSKLFTPFTKPSDPAIHVEIRQDQ